MAATFFLQKLSPHVSIRMDLPISSKKFVKTSDSIKIREN